LPDLYSMYSLMRCRLHLRIPSRSWEPDLCCCDLQRNIGHVERLSLAALDASEVPAIVIAAANAASDYAGLCTGSR
jgi:hypothetical protein